MHKRILQLFLPLLFIFCLRPAAAIPYVAVDMGGRILAHNQAFDRWYPASLTKMMTAYVTFQALEAGGIKLQTPIRLSPGAAHVVPSLSGWRAGSTLTLDTALTVMLVKSANDMANAVAEGVKGSKAAFVDEMNMQARRLGMTGTHFSNPSGLPDEQNYSNARDMAILAVQLRRDFPQYAHYFDIPAIDFGKGRKIQPNSNNLIGRYSGADGMKTGFICASGFNLVASATRNGRTVIAVVLGAGRIDIREDMAARLLNQGFKKSGSVKISLATLRPYGANQMQVTNLREQICNAEAGRMRMQYRDEKGHPIFNSPFISVLQSEPLAIPVRPIYEPKPEPAAKGKKSHGGKAAGKRKLAAKSANGSTNTAAKAAGLAAAPQRRITLPPAQVWQQGDASQSHIRIVE